MLKKKPFKRSFPNNNQYPSKKPFGRKNFSKKKPPTSRVQDNKKSNIICYKCGRYGHFKKDCKVKEKINNLNMSDELKEQISDILIYESSDYDSENEEIVQIQQESSSSEEDNCYDSENCACTYKINVLKDETRLALEMVDKITNEDDRVIYLNKLKNILLEENQQV